MNYMGPSKTHQIVNSTVTTKVELVPLQTLLASLPIGDRFVFTIALTFCHSIGTVMFETVV